MSNYVYIHMLHSIIQIKTIHTYHCIDFVLKKTKRDLKKIELKISYHIDKLDFCKIHMFTE